ncbi:unnamed protein product [Ranitomeya imitator]|uniref:Uncharacterized protein n=1 Tax=Ranitomeya imitator TaxID=111125 RepID=A0ABN9L9N7_9NEOB|nr:unnamed protein product [Ranitomeya imitator]
MGDIKKKVRLKEFPRSDPVDGRAAYLAVALALSIGILALLAYSEWTQRSLWESTFTLSLLSIIGSPVQLTVAITSILIGPYCYYTFAGMSSTNYIGYAIKYPFPYTKFQNVCQEPLHYEWYHLALQIFDLTSSVCIMCSSLSLVIKLSARILRTGTLNFLRDCQRPGRTLEPRDLFSLKFFISARTRLLICHSGQCIHGRGPGLATVTASEPNQRGPVPKRVALCLGAIQLGVTNRIVLKPEKQVMCALEL